MFGNTLPYRSVAGNATAKLVLTGMRRLHGYHTFSINNEDNFLHIYDAAAITDVTVGTTDPVLTLLVPAGDGTIYGAGAEDFGNFPIVLKNGLVWAVTKEKDGAATAPDVDCGVNFRYS